jgi:hypothetical protein
VKNEKSFMQPISKEKVQNYVGKRIYIYFLLSFCFRLKKIINEEKIALQDTQLNYVLLENV